ncbi:MAG: glutathione S-transferase [Pseudomonadota bacterium]
MRLWHNRASPFVRKVRIAAREAVVAERIEEIEVMVSPVNVNSELAACNPLVKIPALQTDDGTVLYDSAVICEYLDGFNTGARMFPADQRRWQVLRLQALGDGILDAAVSRRYELAVRPPEYRWQGWLDGQMVKIRNGADVLEREVQDWGERFEIGQITAACVLGYLDFRFPEEAWRQLRPRLAAWYERIRHRPSVAATAPA